MMSCVWCTLSCCCCCCCCNHVSPCHNHSCTDCSHHHHHHRNHVFYLSTRVCATSARHLPDHSPTSACFLPIINKKHLKNVGPIRYCEPPLHCQSPGVASRTPAIAIAQASCDVHNDDNDNAWQRGPLWPHGMGPITIIRYCGWEGSRRFGTTLAVLSSHDRLWTQG